ncbi:MAG TPA: exodeoxyribonuclease V subunit gamma, partial [Opitutales bacterium]|nr:exodeoxyribonuclease V subunit gamma [Opitutales bacterium]
HGFQPFVGGERFYYSESDSLLGTLQKDIAQLEQREDFERIQVDPNDRSIEIHSCHGPMREVEVLHDQLLDRFEEDPTLLPRDVLVMIPDIEEYAPYIEAVFGDSDDPRVRIPYSVVDRRPRTEYHAINVWFLLLELADSRFLARDVVSLLETAPMRKRLRLGEADLASLRLWIEATGIRWGIDAEHRAAAELPDFHETTWRSGIEQWLLGYAMHESGDDGISWSGIFPFDEVEGRNLTLLERYLEALDLLFDARFKLSEERTLGEWTVALGEFLELLFGDMEEVAFEVDKLRDAIDRLDEQADFANVEEKLPLEVIRYVLGKRVDDTVTSGRFLSGGVTFCTLQPMRTIPARVIALLGMDDNAFPRRPQQLGFDRMRDQPAVGDRSVREDDRYLFLETLLSARDSLIISHSGQSSRDLSASPPSVAVAELIDHLEQTCVFPGGVGASKFLVKRHRLQPFHPKYFRGSELFSYSKSNAAASRRLMEGEKPERPFFQSALAEEPEENFRTVQISQLIRFFRNPAQYLLQERLGLQIPDGEMAIDDSELFALDGLHSYHLKNNAVRNLIEKEEEPEWERMLALGQAPVGGIGRALCREVEDQARKFSGKVLTHLEEGVEGESRELESSIGPFLLRGVNGPFFGDRLVFYRPAKLKGRDVVDTWIRHLAGCLQSNGACRTIFVAEDETLEFGPVEEAEEHLGELLDLYWAGLQRPLPFFPETAYAWYRTVTGEKPENAFREANNKFESGFNYTGERENEYIQLCWGSESGKNILNEEFTEISEKIFQGLVLSEIQREGRDE